MTTRTARESRGKEEAARPVVTRARLDAEVTEHGEARVRPRADVLRRARGENERRGRGENARGRPRTTRGNDGGAPPNRGPSRRAFLLLRKRVVFLRGASSGVVATHGEHDPRERERGPRRPDLPREVRRVLEQVRAGVRVRGVRERGDERGARGDLRLAPPRFDRRDQSVARSPGDADDVHRRHEHGERVRGHRGRGQGDEDVEGGAGEDQRPERRHVAPREAQERRERQLEQSGARGGDAE